MDPVMKFQRLNLIRREHFIKDPVTGSLTLSKLCQKATFDDKFEICIDRTNLCKCSSPKLLVKHWSAGHPNVKHKYIRASYSMGDPVFCIEVSKAGEKDIILDSDLDIAWARRATWY